MHRNALLLVIIGMFVGCGTREQGESLDKASVPVVSTAPDQSGEADGPLGVGATPPAILAEGWLNGTAPSESELVGKVIVVDVWAYW